MEHFVEAMALSEALFSGRIWPPECCVPAFVHAAMVAKNVALPEPDALPGILGVRVRADQDNPLGLALADQYHPPGIRAVDAEREINRLFTKLGLQLQCRRIPFLEVGFGLWEEVLDVALARDLVLGLGVDFSVLMQRSTQRSAQHVLRVLTHVDDRLEVVDDSGEATQDRFFVTTDRASMAVLAIPDGFWMIGEKQCLQLPFTLPWRATQ
jgi:hypothetical protein